MRIRPHDLLAIELKNQSQHTVGSGMLRAKIDGVMSYLPLFRTVTDVSCAVHEFDIIRIDMVAECWVDFYEASAC